MINITLSIFKFLKAIFEVDLG